MNKAERLEVLLAECKRTTIDAIIGPFGLSYALFADKDGGYVDTVHNVREGVWIDEEKKRRYDEREEYDSGKYHADKRYKDRNAETSRRRKAGETIEDGYSDRPIKPGDKKDLDHDISAKETHDDPALVLADLDSPEDKIKLANDESNLQDTNQHINRGKGELSMDEYIDARKKKIANIEDTISRLEQKQREGTLTDGQKRALEKAKADKKKFDEDGFNEEKARAADKEARTDRDKKINDKYRKKFLKETGKQCVINGVKMGLQQVLGMFLHEFTDETLIQIRVILTVHRPEDGDLFTRVRKSVYAVYERIKAKAKWKDILSTFGEGSLVGVLSTAITTLVNTFATTAKRFVRAIREGFMSFIKAFKVLFVHPSEWTGVQVKYQFVKLLVGAVITTVGVVIDGALQQGLAALPFGSQIAGVLSAILVGIATALACYFIDGMAERAQRRKEFTEKTVCLSEKMAALSEELVTVTEGYLKSVMNYRESIRKNEELNNMFVWLSDSYDMLNETNQTYLMMLKDSAMARERFLVECRKDDAFTALGAKKGW